MSEPTASAAPPPEPTLDPTRRPLPLTLVSLVNALMSGPFLVAMLVHAQLPPQFAALPHGYWLFAKLDAAVLLASAVGLWMQRRWGFGLMVLAYFSSVIALVVLRRPFACQAMVQFPMLAMASLQWKHLR